MSHAALVLTNARLPGLAGRQQLHFAADGTLQAIHPMTIPLPEGERLDLAGDWLSPGGVDLQINGALGLAFPDLDMAHLPTLDKICEFLWQQGIDAFLPTLVTTSVAQIHQALDAIATQTSHPPNPKPKIQNPKSKILGVHLEGPCLNPAKRGAHPAEHLLPLTLNTVKQVLGDYASLVKVMTLAPELDETGLVIPYLRSLGITVSLGHSQATAQQAAAAFAQGATMVTHAFNAMPPLHHREPGLLGAALVHPQVYCGVIADGVHVCPTMLDVLLRTCRGGGSEGLAGASSKASTGQLSGLFLVSDALAPLGLPDGTYPWDTRQIQVCNGTARLADGTLSGTTLPLLQGVKNLVAWGLATVEEAIALATIAPRQALGLAPFPVGELCHPLRWRWEGKTLTVQRVGS
ncbi:MAG: N-acetylglucosamine-6-phosphate deacetylase [Synechococcales bacterium]|nr:N-acetylglucosamine-6-phosphate deacetylase [Synechococcales bacterium]